MATYDDIIVGAGSSGAVLAARLSEDAARRVLLIEAGPHYPSLEATPHDLRDSAWISVVQHDWGYKAEAVKGREIEFPRGKVTGGSSSVNAAIALRGVPADYDEWASLGNPDWTWASVLPYFRKLEADRDEAGPFQGRGGPIPAALEARRATAAPVGLPGGGAGARLRPRGRPQSPGVDWHRPVAHEPARRDAHLHRHRLSPARARSIEPQHPRGHSREPRHRRARSRGGRGDRGGRDRSGRSHHALGRSHRLARHPAPLGHRPPRRS